MTAGVAAPTVDAPLRWLDLASSTVERARDAVSDLGFVPFERALSEEGLARLLNEARVAVGKAKLAEQSDTLPYRASVAACGPEAIAFLSGGEAMALLEAMFGRTFSLAREVSCLTYYSCGDHLGPHRDEPLDRCEVTILVYLLAESPAHGAISSGLNLKVYGDSFQPGQSARQCIPTQAGTIVLGHGSRIWHERPALQPGERVIAITGCYAPVGGSSTEA